MTVAELTSPSGVKVSVNDAAAEVLISAGWTGGDASSKPERSETPDNSWKNDEIKAYADERGIDLGDASKKDDMLAAIAAHSGEDEAPSDDQ